MFPSSRRPAIAGSPGKRVVALPAPVPALPDASSAEPRPPEGPGPCVVDAPAERPATPPRVSADAPGTVARLPPAGSDVPGPVPGRVSLPTVGGASGKRAEAAGGGSVAGGGVAGGVVLRREGGRKSGKRGRESVAAWAPSAPGPERGDWKPVPYPARSFVSGPAAPPPVATGEEPPTPEAPEPAEAPRGEAFRLEAAGPVDAPRACADVPPPSVGRVAPAAGAGSLGGPSVAGAGVSGSPSPPVGPTGCGGTGAWRASVLMHPPFPRARAVSPGTVVLVAPPGADSSSPDTHTRTSEPPSRLNAAAGITSWFRRACASLYGLPRPRREPVREARGICPEHPPTLR